MILTKVQKEFMNKTERFLNEKAFIEGRDYSIFCNEDIELKTGNKKITIKIQLKNNEVIVESLKKLGWKTDHKYFSNGQCRSFSNNDSKDNYGDIEMIQLYF